ncbi:hypothetical protein FTO70_02685 [Methanosarcina sp. KYL-1]|uniref:hypothetical protein n=1 Tax=Methanosarcina sp. KYL-1 TaxID=2602068 RepID=UPI0021009B25|nr:hypothetical protein [Methanosarcina sp. KYL-1]MCQ1534614.1 hypothetical protein [Methanosarcina sp. KYL-1]
MKREKEEIIVLVKATPEKSKMHGHVVGVTGINKEGELRRLYPLKSRYGEGLVDFGKNDRLEVTVTKPEHDLRWESRKVLDYVNLEQPLKDREVRELILPLATSVERLNIEGASLGVVKPEILDVEVKVNSTEVHDRQQYFSLMGDFLEKRERGKIPVEIRYVFRCEGEEACRGHKVIVLDWELNETVRKIMRSERDGGVIEKKILEQLFGLLEEKELYFIMGTHHRYGTWMVMGVFCPEKDIINQRSLHDFEKMETVAAE